MGDAFTDAAKDARREDQRIERQNSHFSTLLAYLEQPSAATHGAATEAFRSLGYGPDAPEVKTFGEELERLARGERPIWARLLGSAFRNDVGRKYAERLKMFSPFAGMVVVTAKPGEWRDNDLRVHGDRKELVKELAGKRGNYSLETPQGTFIAMKPRRKRGM